MTLRSDSLPQIRLRAVEPEDCDLMLEIENDSSQWESSETLAPLSRRQMLDYALYYDADPFAAGQIRLVVTMPDGMPVGLADLYEISQRHRRAFAAIYILPTMRRRGLALAALDALSRYAFETLGLHQIAARILKKNTSSEALFEKAGYRFCGYLDEWHFVGNSPLSVGLWQLLPSRTGCE